MNVTCTKVFATCRPHVRDVNDFFVKAEKLEIMAQVEDLGELRHSETQKAKEGRS